MSDTEKPTASAGLLDRFFPSSASESTKACGADGDDGDTFTVDTAMERLGFGRVQWRVTAMCGILWAADGVESTILAIVAPEARCVFNISPWSEALLTTVVFAGMLVGAALWGRMADINGRRLCVVISTVAVIYFGLLSAFSVSYPWLLALRGIFGFAMAGLPQSVTYFMEMVPVKTRAACSAFLQLVYSLGMIGAAGMAIGIMSALNWRYLLAFSVFAYILVLPLALTIPESPLYYISRGKLGSAMDSLQDIARGNGKELPSGQLVKRCNALSNEGLDQPAKAQADAHGILDLFRPLKGLVTTLLLWLIWFLIAFTYFGVLLMTTELLEMYHGVDDAAVQCLDKVAVEKVGDCHHLDKKDYLDVLWTSLAELPAIAICYGLNHILRRRASIAVHSVCASVMGAFLIICPLSRAGVVGLIFGMRSFLSSLFITMYLYTSEVYPTAMRATGLGAAYTWGRVGGITTPFISQVMLRHTIRGTKLFYALTSLLIGVAGLLLPYETKGRSLEDGWGT
eukprot:scpid69834/ scgid1271/ Synaptic vesicle 2-related protein